MGRPIARDANIMRYAPMASSLSRSGISSGCGSRTPAVVSMELMNCSPTIADTNAPGEPARSPGAGEESLLFLARELRILVGKVPKIEIHACQPAVGPDVERV